MSNKTHAKKSRSKQKVSSARVRKRTRKEYRQLKKSRRAASSTPSSSFSNLRISLILILFSAQCVTPLMINRNSRAFLTDSSDSSENDTNVPQNVFNSGPSSPDSSARSTDFFLSDARILESDPTGLFRVRRNPDAFSKYINANLQPLARISSGASLEIGLINGKISSDVAVAELLRMGDLNANALSQLNQADIDSVLTEFEGLPNNLPSEGEVAELEKRLVTLETIRGRLADFEKFSKMTGKKEYQESLGHATELGSMAATVTSLKNKLVSLSASLLDIRGTPREINDQNIQTALAYMPAAAMNMKDIISLVEPFKSVIAQLEKAKLIQEKSKFLNIFKIENDFRTGLKSPKYNQADIDALLKNFETVFAAAKKVSTHSAGLEAIQELVSTRRPRHRQVFQYTSGLPNGFNDLNQLNIDSGNSWITKHVSNGSLFTKSLKDAFHQFGSLSRDLSGVENQWTSLNTPAKLKSVNDLIESNLKLATLPGDPDSIQKDIESLKMCHEPVKSYPGYDLKEVTAVETAMKALNDEIKTISDFKYLDQFDDIETFRAHFNIENMSDDQKKALAKDTLSKLDTEEFTSFETKLKRLLNDVTKFEVFALKIPTLVTNIKITDLETHHANTNLNQYTQIYTCLGKIKTKGSPVKDMIDLVANIRKLKVDSEAKKTINAIVGSGAALQQVLNSAKALKDVKNPGIAALTSSFEKPIEVSHNLGMGILGLSAIDKANQARSSLKPLLDKADEIVTAAGANGLSTEYETSLKTLQQIPKVFQEIDQFLAASQSLLASRKRRNPSQSFKALGSLFLEADKVQGIPVDLKVLRETMVELHSKTGQTFDKELKILDILEEMDLNFARFQVKNAISPLEAMDTFFAKYEKAMTTLPALPSAQGAVSEPPRFDASSPLSSSESGKTSRKSEIQTFLIDHPEVVIIPSILIAAGIALLLMSECCGRCRKTSNRKDAKRT